MADKGVVIRLTKPSGHWPTGTELGIASVEDAKAMYPDAEIIAWADWTAYEPPALSDEAVADISRMKRDELNAYATDQGIEDAEGFPNKDALIAAIEEGAAAEAPSDGEAE